MGESAAKLRQIFDAITEVRGVYFFDEFDALGSQRSSANDVGEVRRILNSFLQMLEQDQSNSLIICATNHLEILDHALFRRFDDVVRYELPQADNITTLFKSRLQNYVAADFSWQALPEKAKGLSSAEITQAAEDAIKEMLMNDDDKITTAVLNNTIAQRHDMKKHLQQ